MDNIVADNRAWCAALLDESKAHLDQLHDQILVVPDDQLGALDQEISTVYDLVMLLRDR